MIMKKKSFHQYSWNSEVETIWIRVTPQDLYCRPQMYYRCVFPDSRKRANDHSALKQAQTSNWSESIFHRKENRKPNCANRLMDPFIGFVTYSTSYINQNREKSDKCLELLNLFYPKLLEKLNCLCFCSFIFSFFSSCTTSFVDVFIFLASYPHAQHLLMVSSFQLLYLMYSIFWCFFKIKV